MFLDGPGIKGAGIEQIMNLAGDKELVLTRGDGLLEERLEGDRRAVSEGIGDRTVLVLGEREVGSEGLNALLKGSLTRISNRDGIAERSGRTSSSRVEPRVARRPIR